MTGARSTDTGDAVYMVPNRASRPRGDQATGCPFCPGNEDRTPPTTQQLPAEGTWSARAFANKYPITAFHEVVVDTTQHVPTFAGLDDDAAATAFRLYRDRTAAAHGAGLEYLLFRNEGAHAGGSVPHSHAQIAAEPDGFPRQHRPLGAGRPTTVHEAEGFEVQVPEVGRFPYEVHVRPRADGAFHTLSDAAAGALGRLVATASRALGAKVGDKGWNLVLHRSTGSWRIELLPRTETLAGLELGGGVYANVVDASSSVDFWRQAFTRARS